MSGTYAPACAPGGSGAVSLNLIIYGLTAPFATALMERFGIRGVVAAALVMVSLGAGLTMVMTEAWRLWFLWGPVGGGTGAMALVLGASVANRWSVRHRGLVTGIFSAGSATGQLVILPLIAQPASGPGALSTPLTQGETSNPTSLASIASDSSTVML